jgi:HPt (histidine-containing phosphotransfer) domain-containing protein
MEKPNLTYIRELSDGDKVFEQQLITILKKEFPGELLAYQKNIKNNNFLETAQNVHKLKHKISILGLEKSYEIASEFEKELKREMKSNQFYFEKVLAQISLYLNTI